MVTETAHLNFYGDDSIHKNKLYSFKVNNEADARAGVKRFRSQGIHIRAAWFTIKRDRIIIYNVRISNL